MSTIGVNNHTCLIAPSQGLFPPPPKKKKKGCKRKQANVLLNFMSETWTLIKHRQKWAKIKANFVLNRLPDRIANTSWRILHSFLVKFRYLKISSLFFNWILHLVQFPSHKTLQKKHDSVGAVRFFVEVDWKTPFDNCNSTPTTKRLT